MTPSSPAMLLDPDAAHVGDGPHSGAHGLRRLVLSQQVLEADSVLPRHCYPPQSITPWSLARFAKSPCRHSRTTKPPSENPLASRSRFSSSDSSSTFQSDFRKLLVSSPHWNVSHFFSIFVKASLAQRLVKCSFV